MALSSSNIIGEIVRTAIEPMPVLVLPCAKMRHVEMMRDMLCHRPGLAVDLLLLLETFGYKFRFIWKNTGAIGNQIGNGTWNGRVGEMLEDRLDVAVFGVLTSSRIAAANFT